MRYIPSVSLINLYYKQNQNNKSKYYQGRNHLKVLDRRNNLCALGVCNDFSMSNLATSPIFWRHDVDRHTLTLNFPKNKNYKCNIGFIRKPSRIISMM